MYKEQEIYPMPEIIRNKKWQIKDGAPQNTTSLIESGQISVPLNNSDFAADIRLREMGKVRLVKKLMSLDRAPGSLSRLYSTVKHQRAIEIGVDIMATRTVEKNLKMDIQVFYPSLVILNYMQDLSDKVAILAPLIAKNYASDNQIEQVLKMHTPLSKIVSELRNIALSTCRSEIESLVYVIRLIDRLISDEKLSAENRRAEKKSSSARLHGKGTGKAIEDSGVMHIKEAESYKVVRRDPFHGVNMRPKSYGTDLSFMDRFFDDKKIFVRIGRKKFLNILIDHSGSMSISPRLIKQITEKIPANIATYSGSEARGELKILAKNNKIADKVEDYHSYGPGNIIDYPALLWLAKQGGTKIWISDGEVTGIDDKFYRSVNKAIRELTSKSGIIRFPNLGALTKAMPSITKHSFKM